MDDIIKKLEEPPVVEYPEPKPEPEPPVVGYPEPKPEVVNNMNMYLVRYGHLERILVNVGDVCQADIMWSGKLSPATQIGISGNTGISTATHTHIDVVKVPYDPNFRYEKYTQQNIFDGNPPADEEELHYFADDTLFKAPLKITTHYLSEIYRKQFNRVHPALDVVSQGAKIIYWNRSTRGRVVHTGYDNAYGNNVVIAYFDVSFDSYANGLIVKPKPEEESPVVISDDNDLSADWQNSVHGFLYNMVNKSTEKSTYGQSSKFEGKVRYIEMHPNNFGIIKAMANIEDTGFAGMNGTFFWYIDDAKTDTYPTSILKVKNKVLREQANHLPYPQGVFCYYQDGTFGIEQVKNARDLSKPVWWAIGGTEYVRNSLVTYNMTSEGFIGKFADVHRRTEQTSIGFTKEGKILLVRHWDSDRAECAIHMREMGCVYALGLDGGGSTQYTTPTEKRLSSRKVDHLLVATDLKI